MTPTDIDELFATIRDRFPAITSPLAVRRRLGLPGLANLPWREHAVISRERMSDIVQC